MNKVSVEVDGTKIIVEREEKVINTYHIYCTGLLLGPADIDRLLGELIRKGYVPR